MTHNVVSGGIIDKTVKIKVDDKFRTSADMPGKITGNCQVIMSDVERGWEGDIKQESRWKTVSWVLG